MNSTRTLAEIEAEAASFKRLAASANQTGMYAALATIERKLEALRAEWREVNAPQDDNAAEAALAAQDAQYDADVQAAEAAEDANVAAFKAARDAQLTKVELGMYRTADGTMYRVYPARNGGHLLAKRLVEKGGDAFGFEYAGAAGRFVKASDRMTLDEAKAWGQQWGSCCICAALLTDPTSVAAGIGPVCGGRV